MDFLRKKREYLEKAEFYKKGTIRTRDNGTTFRTKTDLYELENKYLNSPDSIDELKTKINKVIIV